MNYKQYKTLFKKINSKVVSLPKTKALIRILRPDLIILYLIVESILINRKFKGNIFKEPFFILNSLWTKIKNFEKMKDNLTHDLLKEKRSKNLDKFHKGYFQTLWTNYTKKQFINDRLKPYIKRVKINKLTHLIKGKKCIDFGCGHGQFLMALKHLGAKSCYGIDVGKDSITYANKMARELKFNSKNIKYVCSNATSVKVKSESFDFAIQNGVFHHIINDKSEIKAYKEVHRVLKKRGYFFIHVAGEGIDSLRGITLELSTRILENFSAFELSKYLLNYPVTHNKKYMLRDNLIVKYKNTTWKKYIKFLKKMGFRYIRPLRGHSLTDFDKHFSKDKQFNSKFGEGHLRLLCQKI
jgi:ubiquinone/menaquinone biosynthesis C-methylase UbiE